VVRGVRGVCIVRIERKGRETVAGITLDLPEGLLRKPESRTGNSRRSMSDLIREEQELPYLHRLSNATEFIRRMRDGG